MSLLATPEALASRLQEDVDTSTATDALTQASELIRRISRQQIDFVSQETVIIGGGERILTLPQRPLVVDGSNPLTITELAYFGGVDISMVEGRDYMRIGNELTRGYPWWWQTKVMGWPFRRPLGVWSPRVQVTYSHGYTVVPDDIVSLVLDIAQMMYANPLLRRSLTVGGFSETYAAEILGKTTVDGIKSVLASTGRRRGSFSI